MRALLGDSPPRLLVSLSVSLDCLFVSLFPSFETPEFFLSFCVVCFILFYFILFVFYSDDGMEVPQASIQDTDVALQLLPPEGPSEAPPGGPPKGGVSPEGPPTL